MPITTKTVLSITPEEQTRVDALEQSQARRIAALEAELATRPPAPVTPPVTPPSTGRTGLWVSGGALMTAQGVPVQYRGIEALWGPTSASNVAKAIGAMKGFGANAVAPLFQRAQSTAAHVWDCIQESERQGMMTAVNADAAGVDRAWLKRSDIVTRCNAGKGVILECEVELGDKASMSASQWRDLAISFVLDLRNAGHTAPIRVGSPSGGRSPSYALKVGRDVLAADPLHSSLFTWQAYWDRDPSGAWEYATSEGFNAGTAGALECADMLRNSGLCWLVGLDGADDIGPTPYLDLAMRLHQHGIAWQWWAMFVGDSYGNGLTIDALSSNPKAPFGQSVMNLLKAQSKMVSF